MLDLVSEADKELEISALRWVTATEMLPKALAQVPMLWLSVYLNISITLRILSFLLVPGLLGLAIEDRVEQSRPGHRNQDDVMGGSETRSGSVVNVDGCDRCGPTLFEVVLSCAR